MLNDVSLDPSGIDNPWAAIVALVLILAVFVYYLRKTTVKASEAVNHAKRAADTIEHESQPNSGKSMKDSLNRIEAITMATGERMTSLESRVAILELSAERRGRRMWRR